MDYLNNKSEFKDFKDEPWYKTWLYLAHQNQQELDLLSFNYDDVEAKLQEEFRNNYLTN